MRFEDQYPEGSMQNIKEFDVADFVEQVITSQKEEGGFKYDNSVLRPRHIIELYKMFERVGTEKVFQATELVVTFKGVQYEIKTRRASTISELIMSLEERIITQEFTILLGVFRFTTINPNTFVTESTFNLRVVDLS